MTKITFGHEYYMQQAFKQAEEAFLEDEIPVGVVVVCNDVVIAKAHNLTETLNDVTAHAEMLAITQGTEYLGGKYLHDCTLYVTLEPCPMCAGALHWSQITRIVYGARDEKRGCLKHSPTLFHPRTEVIGGILEDKCGEIMKRFFQRKR